MAKAAQKPLDPPAAEQNTGAAPAALDIAAAAKPIPRHLVGLSESRWQLAEHRNPGHWICVPAGTTIAELLEPAFWANVARHLKPNVTVEVHWDDSSRFAELYVLAGGRNWASVCVIREHELTKPKLPAGAGQHAVAFNGPVDLFRVTRLTDGAVLSVGHASERDAQAWLDQHLRATSS